MRKNQTSNTIDRKGFTSLESLKEFATPKPYERITSYRPISRSAPNLNVIEIKNRASGPKTKYLTIVEMKCHV